MTDVEELKKKWIKNPKFVKEYEALADEFVIAHALIKARSEAGMTQAKVAERMQVSQARIARIESGVNVSIASLKRYAEATGTTLNISLDPVR